MSAELAEPMMSADKRYFKMSDVLAAVNAAGIDIDEETVDYHLYRTRKMPKPVKKVKRERYWATEQIQSFITEL